MKSTCVALLFLLAVASGSIHAKQIETPAVETQAPLSAELEGLSKSWMAAMLDRDKAKLEALMAPGFVLHVPGSPFPEVPRALWLDNLFNHMDIDQWEQADFSTQIYETIGVVTSRYQWAGTRGGSAFDAAGFCTDVWKSASGVWQVLSRTCMEFPDAALNGQDGTD